MWLSTNLLGLFVRGLFPNLKVDKIKTEINNLVETDQRYQPLKKEVERYEKANKLANFLYFLIIIGYLYATYHFFNIGVTAVAILFMIVRLQDLLWEIKTGQRLNRIAAFASIPKNAWYYITSLLSWIALPALYYFLFLYH